MTPPIQNEAETTAVNANEIKLETKTATIGNNSLVFNVNLPEGFHLNPNAPQRYELSVAGGRNVKIVNPSQKFKTLPVVVPFTATGKGAANLKAKLTVYYCREDNTGVCLIKSLVWNVPINVVADRRTARKIEISTTVEQ